ncbi:MAG: molybdopterin-binding protein [Pseudomonadota bacterium]
MFASVVMVDWSGGNDRGARPKRDAIWIGEAGQAPLYVRNRGVAEAWLIDRIERAKGAQDRLLIGFDFPFGFPAGLARAVTGRDDPFALWAWLEARVQDAQDRNNRWHVAAEMNACLPGIGPFWGNGGKTDVPNLPRKGRMRQGHGLPERRRAETLARGAFPVWQLAGAGSVGSQTLMGLPVLQRLRRRFGDLLSIWPFEPATAPVVIAEIWPSLLSDAVKAVSAPDDIRDAVQVRMMSAAFAALPDEVLAKMLAVTDAEEGWILGLGFEDTLRDAVLRPAPPPLSDDCFALPPGVAWTPVADALDRLRAALRPVVGVTSVPLSGALGRILAEDIMALRAHPPTPNAAVDGYGFAHASTGAGEVCLPLMPGRAAAGQPFSGTVPHGSALRILTGAALPDGVDTVVLEEDCTVTPAAVAFQGTIRAGANTRKAGEDMVKGAPVVQAGQRLRPPDLGLLSATGHSAVPVYRRLRVGVLSTGDEILEAGRAGDGMPDANRPMLLSLIEAWGYDPVDLGIAQDRRDAVRAALDKGSAGADAILTSGGASAGDEDHISALLKAEGTLSDWRIALKPGRPLALAMWGGCPVFGLPGNPVAALVCTLIFARPALAVLAGGQWLEPLRLRVPAAFAKRKKPGRNEYLRARLTGDGRAEVFASEGSGRISGLAWAEGLVEFGPDACEIAPGDPVTYLPYAGFGISI